MAGGPCSIMFPTIIRRQEGKIIPNNDKRGNKVASSLIKPSYRGRKSLSSQIIPKEFGGRQARVYIKNRIANNPVSQCSGFGRPDGRVGRAEVRSPFQSSSFSHSVIQGRLQQAFLPASSASPIPWGPTKAGWHPWALVFSLPASGGSRRKD